MPRLQNEGTLVICQIYNFMDNCTRTISPQDMSTRGCFFFLIYLSYEEENLKDKIISDETQNTMHVHFIIWMITQGLGN